ncbi:ribosome-binding protein 1-like isoform X2 [Branchiostoma floridae]|uniref:Ribosome-binding protein 1-like isoform X2 n=1 Tax=Branchiostoma floridae TaxID=7739 RepID=A0A9J7N8N5_BRAFL|nr:ribosome-binding protein 1-like isoform X2 [Branchiostoma floridae]
MDVSDPQTLAIAVFGGFVLVSAICIFLVSTFGMKETTYEEAMERQRRAIERELQQTRAEKQKAREKKPARFNKKEKPKKEPSGLPEPQRDTSTSPRVQEVKPFAEQKAQPETPPQPQPKAKGKAKDKNKENQAPNKEQTAPAAPKAAVKTVEPRVAKAQPQPVPVKAAVRVAPEPKGSPEPSRKVLAKETVKAEAAPLAQQVVAPAPSKKKKTTKIEAAVTVAGDAPGMTAVMDSLVTSVQAAKLSDVEMQQLVDIMLTKQGRKASDWAKAGQKADSVKKDDVEKKLQDEQKQVLAAHQKMKELRQELQQERVRFSTQETALQQKVSQQQQEIQALYTRMKTTHEQHLAENQKLHNQLAEIQTNSSQEAHIVQLQEENKILKSAVNEATKGTEMRIQNDLANLRTEHARLKNEYNSIQARLQAEEDGRRKAETSLTEAQQQVRQVHASQRDAESSLTKRLNEVTEQLRKSEAKNNAMGSDIKKSKEAADQAEAESKSLKDKLSSLESQLSSLQASQVAPEAPAVEDASGALQVQLGEIQAELSEVKSQLAQANQQLSQTQSESDDTKSQLKSSQSQLTDTCSQLEEARAQLQQAQTQLQEAVSLREQLEQRVEAADSQVAQSKLAQETKDKEVQELNKKNKALSEELESAKSSAVDTQAGGDAGAQELQLQLKDLQVQLAESRKTVEDKEKLIKELQEKSKAAEVPSANGDIEHKVEGSSMQTISVVEHELLISEKEKTVTQLQEEVAEKKAEIETLQTTVEQQKKKNNDLREKNWKAMDALNAAEKSLADKEKVTSAKDDTATSDQDRSQAREALQRIFPDISMDASLEYQVWLTSFEKAALSRLEELQTAAKQSAKVPTQTSKDEGVEAQLAEAAEREKELQEECEKYKTVLADTESILNRLQSSVESEEQKWQEKLRLANEDLEQARGEVRAMQEAVQQVKSESQQGSEEQGRLQDQLKVLQEERDKLQQELQTLQAAAGSGQAENGPAGPTEEDLSKRDEEIAALKARLEKEKKLCKELGSAATKLQSLLKTAEDQLKKERENVKKLQGNSEEKGSTDQSDVVEAPQSLNQSQIEKDLADALQEVQATPDDGTSV